MVSIEEYKLNEEEQKQEKDKGTREWEGVWMKSCLYEGENGHTVRVKQSGKFRKQGEKRGREAEVKRIRL